MKHLFYILLLIASGVTILYSCGSDDTPQPEQDKFRYDMVTYNGYAQDMAQFTYLPRLDGTPIRYIAHMGAEPTLAKGRRVLLNYYIPAGATSEANQTLEVKVKGITSIITDTLRIATKERIDGLAQEHIRLFSIWRTGDYINLHAEVEHTGKARWFYLLADKVTQNSDVVDCYLIHDTFGEKKYHWRTAYASFYIGNLWKRQSCKTLRIHLNDDIAPLTHEYCFSKQ